jgi:uracil-DNA glycosylase
METLIKDIQNCRICEPYLEHGCRPVFSVSAESRILIIGQAPGRKVHESGVPWQDKSGDNLREWLGVSETEFYNPSLFGIVPMGFCYPGTGKSGDLAPRKECAPEWHGLLLERMKNVGLTLLVGQYAQKYYLKKQSKRTLTETVKNFKEYLPEYLPLPHPSPRNNIWQSKNPWFGEAVLPTLMEQVRRIIEK